MNEAELIQGYSEPGLQDSKPKRNARKDPLAETCDEEGGSYRYVVCITSFRTRLLDEDNLAGGSKFLIDCLRPSIIPEDSPGVTHFEWRQIKVAHRNQEGTEIRIEEVER